MILDFEVFHPMKLQPVRICLFFSKKFQRKFFISVGGCSHLTSFTGTDTISACVLARNYYNSKEIAGHSIPASEHSTMVSWKRENEINAYRNMIGKIKLN